MLGNSLVFVGIFLAAVGPAGAEPSAPKFTLHELRIIARDAHPTLDSAAAALQVAAGFERQAGAYPNPDAAFMWGKGRPRAGGTSRSETGFVVRQPIELPGIRRWRARAAELGLRGAEFERLQAQSVVDSTVARLTYGILLEERRTEIARESAEVARRFHELLLRRAELGESSPLEAVRAESEWFARRRDVLDAEGALEVTRSALDLFCGGRLGRRFEIAETLKGEELTPLPSDLVERLRSQNPLLLRVEAAIEEAQARVELADKQTLPGFDLFLGYENELDRTAWSLGVGLMIPIWNRNRGAVEAAGAEGDRAAADRRALIVELETALAQAVTEFQRASSASRLHGEGWTAAAQRALDIAIFSFENGEATLFEVLDTQRSYLDVVLTEAEASAEIALARAEIELLIGGPWKSEAIDESR
jgi:cobalt-zinc-cadmium efflux system outer membrane protein